MSKPKYNKIPFAEWKKDKEENWQEELIGKTILINVAGHFTQHEIVDYDTNINHFCISLDKYERWAELSDTSITYILEEILYDNEKSEEQPKNPLDSPFFDEWKKRAQDIKDDSFNPNRWPSVPHPYMPPPYRVPDYNRPYRDNPLPKYDPNLPNYPYIPSPTCDPKMPWNEHQTWC